MILPFRIGLRILPCLVLGACFLVSKPAQAQVVPYTATDAGAGYTDPHPNSDAEAALFDTAASGLGSESIVDFESAPVGSFSASALTQV